MERFNNDYSGGGGGYNDYSGDGNMDGGGYNEYSESGGQMGGMPAYGARPRVDPEAGGEVDPNL